MARRSKEEVEARDKAIEDADVAAALKEEADTFIRKLQQQHGEQVHTGCIGYLH